MKIRTTMRPDVELDVDPAEYTDLARMGVLTENTAPKRADQAQLPPDVLDPSKKES